MLFASIGGATASQMMGMIKNSLFLFFILNQYQLMFSVILLGAYVHKDILYFLLDFKYASFDFKFLEAVSYTSFEGKIKGNPQVQGFLDSLSILQYTSNSFYINEF